jgi:hypothetical protein
MRDSERFEDARVIEHFKQCFGDTDSTQLAAIRATVLRAAYARPRPRWFARRLGVSPPRSRMGKAVVVASVMCLLSVGVVYAATSILDLGRPTDAQSTNSHFPLSGFHRTAVQLRAHGVPALVWIGTAWPGDAMSAVERWPVVKALEQFGTFSKMVPAAQPCSTFPGVSPHRGETVLTSACGPPSFDWTGATYHSRFLAFVHKDLIGPDGTIAQTLSPAERRLYDRYVRQQPGFSVQAVAASIKNFDTAWVTSPAHTFPLVAVGGYVETQSQMPLLGDFVQTREMNTPPPAFTHGLPFALYDQPLTFNQARTALASARAPSAKPVYGLTPVTFTGLVPDVNAEANVITTLICHADGNRPAAVCHRPVIRRMLKAVR